MRWLIWGACIVVGVLVWFVIDNQTTSRSVILGFFFLLWVLATGLIIFKDWDIQG